MEVDVIAGRITRSVDGEAIERAQMTKNSPPVGLGAKRQLILVVEDNRHDWEIYGKILWYNGYDVLYAPEGEEGLRLAREHQPDLILLDLVMPKLDGMSVCKQLKKDPLTARVPIIVLSARPYSEVGAAAERAGCAKYLEKPSSPIDVLHVVEDLIGRAPLPGDGPAPQKYPPTA
jgi:CheY-like chemotaxis protein